MFLNSTVPYWNFYFTPKTETLRETQEPQKTFCVSPIKMHVVQTQLIMQVQAQLQQRPLSLVFRRPVDDEATKGGPSLHNTSDKSIAEPYSRLQPQYWMKLMDPWMNNFCPVLSWGWAPSQGERNSSQYRHWIQPFSQ